VLLGWEGASFKIISQGGAGYFTSIGAVPVKPKQGNLHLMQQSVMIPPVISMSWPNDLECYSSVNRVLWTAAPGGSSGTATVLLPVCPNPTTNQIDTHLCSQSTMRTASGAIIIDCSTQFSGASCPSSIASCQSSRCGLLRGADGFAKFSRYLSNTNRGATKINALSFLAAPFSIDESYFYPCVTETQGAWPVAGEIDLGWIQRLLCRAYMSRCLQKQVIMYTVVNQHSCRVKLQAVESGFIVP